MTLHDQACHDQLVTLRLSIARVAQVLNVIPPATLPLHTSNPEQIYALARTQTRGWNELCMGILDAALYRDPRR